MKAFKFAGLVIVGAAVTMASTAQLGFPKAQLQGKTIRMISPTTVDPGLKTDQNDDNVAIVPRGTPRPELFVWLPGTNGHPAGDAPLLTTASNGGYRVIGLQYNNHLTVENICRAKHDPECLTRAREERFVGGVKNAEVVNSPEEGVEHRLTMLLKYLSAKFPEEGWGQYLDGDAPAWKKIVLAGHSQGAAMTAYIAKHREVARAVLFSGGADGDGNTLETRKWSSWLTMPSQTPPARWYAEYNAQEAIAQAEPTDYVSLLQIPASHVLVFSLDLPSNAREGKGLVAHMSVVHDPRYQPQWQWMIGTAEKRP